MLQLPEADITDAPVPRAKRTAAQIAKGDAAVLAAFRQLEFGLADMVQMTSIAGTLVESLGSESMAVSKTEWTAKQAMQELKKTSDQLMYMVYEIEQKAQALNEEWHAAASAGDYTFEEPEDQSADDEPSGTQPRHSARRSRSTTRP